MGWVVVGGSLHTYSLNRMGPRTSSGALLRLWPAWGDGWRWVGAALSASPYKRMALNRRDGRERVDLFLTTGNFPWSSPNTWLFPSTH